MITCPNCKKSLVYLLKQNFCYQCGGEMPKISLFEQAMKEVEREEFLEKIPSAPNIPLEATQCMTLRNGKIIHLLPGNDIVALQDAEEAGLLGEQDFLFCPSCGNPQK